MILTNPEGSTLDAVLGQPLLNKGPRSGTYQSQSESPHQRLAIQLFAKGCTIKEVATALEMTSAAVGGWLRTPWFQKKVTDLMEAAGVDGIMEVLKGEAMNSVLTLIEIRDDKAANAATRKDAAKDILERIYGKPAQQVTIDQTNRVADPIAEAARIERENEILRKRAIGFASS